MSSPSLSSCILMLLFLAFVGNAAFAQDASQPGRGNPTIDPKLVAAGFLESHPDLLHRSRGLDAYGRKDHPKAFREFRRAAYYSDKPSQAIVGEMLWIGLGTEQDRALAHAWMSLAAERGYTSFSTKRDAYWQELDVQEKARAQSEREALWTEYGDASASPRLEAVLLREYRRATGSRLGSSISPLQIVIPGVGSIDGSQYYHPRYWDPVEYRQWQDSIWMDVRIGRVNASELQPVEVGTAIGHPANSHTRDDPEPLKEP